MSKSRISEQAVDADFLVENLGVTTPEAADLVSRDGANPQEGELAARRLERAQNPLAGLRIPKELKSEFTQNTDEVRLEPIVLKNDRWGAGQRW
jgi:hypothetical protein